MIKDLATGFVSNSTVLNIEDGDVVELSILAPPRTNRGVLLIADYGTTLWPLRETSESWGTWVDRSGYLDSLGVAVRYMPSDNGSSFSYEMHTGIDVLPYEFAILREQMPAYSEADGGRHSTGVVDGRTTYNYLSSLSDETPDPTDLIDGAVGYLDRWAGQGNAAYEDAALHLIQTLENFGLEVITQRFVYDSLMTGSQNPEAYNICGYRFGEVNPDKWMVFGAHFDIAPQSMEVC